MEFTSSKFRWIALGDNLTSLLIVFIFGILIVNCLFIDKGYYDTMPQDLFGFLDGIYRVHLGQVPSRDFSTTLGALLYLIPASFLYFGVNIASSVRYYHAFLLLLALFMVLYIQRTRLEALISILFAAVIALALACKYNFGDDPFQVTEAMFYNRIGFVFVTLELVLLIKPTVNKPTVKSWDVLLYIDTALIGLICGFLFYTKFTFGIVALGFTLVNLFADNRTWRAKIILLVGSATIFLLFLIVMEFSYGSNFALYRDVRMAMLSGAGSRIAFIILRRAIIDIPEIAIAIIVPLLILWLAEIKIRAYWVIYGLAVIIAAVVLQTYSFQQSVLFLPLAFILFALSKLQNDSNVVERNSRLPYVLVMVFVSFLATTNVAYPMIINVIVSSIKYHDSPSQLISDNDILNTIRTIPLQFEASHVGKILSPEAVASIKSAPALDAVMRARKSRPLYYYDDLSFPEYEFYLTDGLNAATSGCRKGARIATLDFVNPFPGLLGWPEGGGMIFVAAPQLVSHSHHLKAEEMFRDIDCVLVPKIQAATGVREFLTDVYGQYLDANYVKSMETVLWTVLTAKPE